LCCLLIMRNPALVIRAVQLVLQGSIAVIDVMNGGRGTSFVAPPPLVGVGLFFVRLLSGRFLVRSGHNPAPAASPRWPRSAAASSRAPPSPGR